MTSESTSNNERVSTNQTKKMIMSISDSNAVTSNLGDSNLKLTLSLQQKLLFSDVEYKSRW